MRFVLDLNILGTIMPCQTSPSRWRGRRRRDPELLVMNAYRPLTNIAAYSASKAAITNFTAWWLYTWRRTTRQDRVNAIAPGFFLTDQNRFLLTDKETGAWTPRGQKIFDHTPMGAWR